MKYLYRVKGLSYDSQSPVCFFDSGIGGLTLLKKCSQMLPYEKFIYFADNYNVPYGNMPEDKIIDAVERKFCEIATYLPKAVVIACNTVTALCAWRLRAKYAFPIIGIQPAVKPAVKSGERCVVLATPATVESVSIAELVHRFGDERTKVVACRDLAAYIERNIFDLSATEVVKLLPDIVADSVVLGCTHYIFIEEQIKAHYNCPVFDGLEGTARHLAEILGKSAHNAQETGKNLEKCLNNKGKIVFIGGDEVKNKRVFDTLK